MSDYAQSIDFSDKDALASGNSSKVAKGADIDTELDLISTAIATKYDSNDLASQAQAEAESSNSVLLTPLRIANWSDLNAGLVGDFQALADPNADRILFWDDGASAGAFLTATDGIEINGTNLRVAAALAGAGMTHSSGVLNVIGGAGITANANDIELTDAAASTTNPVDVSSGTISFDIDGLTTMQGNALAATDTFIVSNGSVDQGIEYQDLGFIIQTGQGSQTLALADANTIMEFNGTATLTIPLNSSVAMPIGSAIIIVVDHASQIVTVTAATSVVLNSIFHAGGGSAASDGVRAGGTAVLIKTETDEWYLSGDIST